jgi:hypothetical protein
MYHRREYLSAQAVLLRASLWPVVRLGPGRARPLLFGHESEGYCLLMEENENHCHTLATSAEIDNYKTDMNFTGSLVTLTPLPAKAQLNRGRTRSP